MTIDSQTRRRIARTGLTAHDPAKASPGYTLYAPMSGNGEVYLLDANGNVAHRWQMPYPPGLYGYLLPNGNLFYGGKVRDDGGRDIFEAMKRFKGGVMLEADWDGNILWEHRDPYHHHDARRTESGGCLYMTVARMDDAQAAKIQGGQPGSDAGGMYADVLVEVDADGNRIWEWRAAEHLDPDQHVITFNDLRMNGATATPSYHCRAPVMFSFRNISTVGIIDKASGNVVWQIGDDTLAQQHDPSLLDNGNVLIYDNGSHSRHNPCRHPASSRLTRPPTNRVGIPGQPALQLLQRLHLRRAPPAQRQHPDYRGTLRAHLPGDAGR